MWPELQVYFLNYAEQEMSAGNAAVVTLPLNQRSFVCGMLLVLRQWAQFCNLKVC